MTDRQKRIIKLMEATHEICRRNGIFYCLAYGSILGAVRHKGFIPWDNDFDIFISINDREKFREILTRELPEDMKLFIWDKEENYHPCFDRVSFKDTPHEKAHVDVFSLVGLPSDEKERARFINRCYYTYHVLCCRIKDPSYSYSKNRKKIKLVKAALFFLSEKRIKKIYKRLYDKYPIDDYDEVYSVSSRRRFQNYTKKADWFDTIDVPFEYLMLPIPRNYDAVLTQLYGDYMTPVEFFTE